MSIRKCAKREIKLKKNRHCCNNNRQQVMDDLCVTELRLRYNYYECVVKTKSDYYLRITNTFFKSVFSIQIKSYIKIRI